MIDNIYSELIKNGLLPKDIKHLVIENFDDFFDNKKILERNAIDSLLPELINFLNLQKKTDFYNGFLEFLELLNTVKRTNVSYAIDAIEKFSDDIEEATYKFWILYSLQRESSHFTLEEYSKYTFDSIKDIIEMMIKPYCAYIVYNIYIVNGKNDNFSSIKEKNLGNLINEIIQSEHLTVFFDLTIHTLSGEKNVRLNALRNIGAHNDYKVTGDRIICDIRNNKNEVIEQLKLRKKDLHKIAIDVFDIFKGLKLGYTLFFVDNVDSIKERSFFKPNLRKEQLILNYFSAIQSQGFEIIKFIDSKKESKIILLELLENYNSKERAMHTSQFLYHLWEITKANKNIIEYRDNNNKCVISFEIDGKFCKKIEDGSIQHLEIPKRMKITNCTL